MIARTVKEWLTVARVSKNVKHLFVEGETDARILAHIFGYPDDVDFRVAREVEKSTSESTSLLGGFKLRLTDLAKYAENSRVENVRCLIDSDFAVIEPSNEGCSLIIFTDYANLPVATLTYEWTQGFLMKGYGYILSEIDWTFLTQVLSFSFIARYSSAKQNDPRPAPALSEYVSGAKGNLSFDSSLYVAHYFGLHRATAGPREEDIHQQASSLVVDLRSLANSNDVFDLLYAMLRRSKAISSSTSRESVRHSFLAALDDDLISTGVSELVQWISGEEPR